MKKIAICGAGNAAHVLMALLGQHEDVHLGVFAPYADEALRLEKEMEAGGGVVAQFEGQVVRGRPARISANPADVVSGCEIVLLALPSFAHGAMVDQIAPYLSEGTWLGALPARGGFDLQAQAITRGRGHRAVVFGLQTLPWACRLMQFGRRVDVLGTKTEVDLAAEPAGEATEIARYLGQALGLQLRPVANMLSLSLANTGQLLHPGIMYALFKGWDGKPFPKAETPLFYQGVSAEGAAHLDAMSQEVQAVRRAIEARFPGRKDLGSVAPLFDWLLRSYEDQIGDRSSLHRALATNRAYRGLRAPVRPVGEDAFVPDFQSRYLTEDIPFGLVFTRAVAAMAGVATPAIDEVVETAGSWAGKHYLTDGKLAGPDIAESRIPQNYGITRIEDLV